MWKRKKKNAGLWGTGKEMASRPDDPAELMHWRQEAVHCIAFVEPGINGSTVYFLLLLMPACPVTAWWGRLYEAPQSKPQTSLTFNHWSVLRAGENHWTPIMLHFWTINNSTFHRFKDRHTRTSIWNPLLHDIFSMSFSELSSHVQCASHDIKN